jgi:hypothetical protein
MLAGGNYWDRDLRVNIESNAGDSSKKCSNRSPFDGYLANTRYRLQHIKVCLFVIGK